MPLKGLNDKELSQEHKTDLIRLGKQSTDLRKRKFSDEFRILFSNYVTLEMKQTELVKSMHAARLENKTLVVTLSLEIQYNRKLINDYGGKLLNMFNPSLLSNTSNFKKFFQN